jgi:tetratricopeptide (TPR) repeat protein
MMEKHFKLLYKAKKAGVMHVELKVRHYIIENIWHNVNNYELVFELCIVQNERLQLVSSDDIPEKATYFIPIGNAYYAFKDYPKAIFYYNKVLEEKSNTRNEYPKQSARNGMGLSYRYGYDDFDRSDSCFYAIIEASEYLIGNEYPSYVWVGIAEGNIGINMMLRQEYDRAIPLLKSSMEKMVQHHDYAFASGPAINLADIYLKKGNLSEAKRYIDLANDYQSKMPREGRMSKIYEVMSKYYSAMGNVALSMDFMDSTLKANKQHEEKFNAMLLLRMEQKELAQRQNELIQEKKLRQHAQFRFLILVVAFIVISVLLAFLFLLYRRKRAAYQVLVRKSQQWAMADVKTGRAPSQPDNVKTEHAPSLPNDSDEPEPNTKKNPPDEVDFMIMNEIEQLMTEEKLYRDISLSVDSLAQ